MKYLMIQNPGIAPTECFTLLGCSTTRYSTHSGTIGTFGSGSKHSISLLLRKYQISPIIYCGNLRLEFGCKKKIINDGIDSNIFHQVFVKMSGKDTDNKQVNRTEDLGWVLEHGVSDWNDSNMALREFTANAIDRSIREEKPDEMLIMPVVENQVRAKTGHTRVFIPYFDFVKEFFYSIGQRFLHFSHNNNVFGVLEKSNRNITTTAGACIYKQGVRIREISDKDSLFDYNFDSELQIDESRNAYSSDIKRLALRKLIYGKPGIVDKIVKSLVAKEDKWEHTFNSYDMPPLSEIPQQVKELWKNSFNRSTEDRGVLSSDVDEINVVLKDRGYIPIKVNNNWQNILETLGVKTVSSVLSEDEREGVVYYPYTTEVMASFNRIWTMLGNIGMLGGKEEPEMLCFRKPQKNNVVIYGFYKAEKIYISRDIAEEPSAILEETMLEEVFHYVSGCADFNRGFQDFYFKAMARLLSSSR